MNRSLIRSINNHRIVIVFYIGEDRKRDSVGPARDEVT